jgi:hypothetical protein
MGRISRLKSSLDGAAAWLMAADAARKRLAVKAERDIDEEGSSVEAADRERPSKQHSFGLPVIMRRARWVSLTLCCGKKEGARVEDPRAD